MQRSANHMALETLRGRYRGPGSNDGFSTFEHTCRGNPLWLPAEIGTYTGTAMRVDAKTQIRAGTGPCPYDGYSHLGHRTGNPRGCPHNVHLRLMPERAV